MSQKNSPKLNTTQNSNLRSKKGYSIAEIMVIVFVIGVSSIAVFQVFGIRNDTNKLKARAQEVIRASSARDKTEAFIYLRKELGEAEIHHLPDFQFIPAANGQKATLVFP